MNRYCLLMMLVCLCPGVAGQETRDPSTSSLFVKWQDPQSGVESYVLKAHVAPLQLSFYFTNISYTHDGRYYWFYCANPPSQGRTLGCIDFARDTIYTFPDTRFEDATPLIDLDSGEAYWFAGRSLYKKKPDPETLPVLINRLNYGKGTYSVRPSTHLTFNAAKTSVNIDSHDGNKWTIGELPLDGSPFIKWQEFDVCYNHGQFSPVDPELQLIAQDHWRDGNTGEQIWYQNRIWLIRKGQEAFPIYPDSEPQVKQHTHEWWAADGSRIYYVDYDNGTEYYDLNSNEKVNVWENGTCHSHCDKTGTYFAGDIGTYTWETGCKLAFFNTRTQKEINIVSDFPIGYAKRGAPYHADPHPQFCLDDKYICYTTTVLGIQTVAFVEVEQLIHLTKE
ncbi:MAG: oligogalacturonate lyase family protein [Candidatus Azobacteroides sp.]|nr:oligogalacturonate lyase family protein [Candidatus Azobacteroides sp.]